MPTTSIVQVRMPSTNAHPPPVKPWMSKFPPAVRPYLALTRIDKPIGTLLLFYPTGEYDQSYVVWGHLIELKNHVLRWSGIGQLHSFLDYDGSICAERPP